jgi:hypothetical protein
VIRKTFVLLAVAATPLLAAGQALAQDHVVTPQDLAARLGAAETARQDNLTAVDRFLGSAEAKAAASSVGADVGRVRAGLGALSDPELADLAARVDALQADPVAGLDSDIRTLLVIFLIVAIVILVLQAVD